MRPFNPYTWTTRNRFNVNKTIFQATHLATVFFTGKTTTLAAAVLSAVANNEKVNKCNRATSNL